MKNLDMTYVPTSTNVPRATARNGHLHAARMPSAPMSIQNTTQKQIRKIYLTSAPVQSDSFQMSTPLPCHPFPTLRHMTSSTHLHAKIGMNAVQSITYSFVNQIFPIVVIIRLGRTTADAVLDTA